MKAPTEADVQRACLEYLAAVRVPAWRANSGRFQRVGKDGRTHVYSMAGAKGLSDIVGILPPSGRMLCVEVKSATGKLRPDQAAFLDNARRAGALAFVARSVADLEAALKAEGVVA